MIAVLPTFLTDLAWLLGLILTVAAVSRLAPMRWLWKRLVVQPITEWAEGLANKAIEPINQRMDDHIEYVRYHLGPNGTTEPVHARLSAMEAAVCPAHEGTSVPH